MHRPFINIKHSLVLLTSAFFIFSYGIANSDSLLLPADHQSNVTVKPIYLANSALDSRICCQRGNKMFFTTNSGCKRAGGRIIMRRTCFDSQKRVCCKLNNRIYNTSLRNCLHGGGKSVSFAQGGKCGSRKKRICCQIGNNASFASSVRCQARSGRIIADRVCINNQRRICCQQGAHDFFSTVSQCRLKGGKRVPDRRCK